MNAQITFEVTLAVVGAHGCVIWYNKLSLQISFKIQNISPLQLFVYHLIKWCEGFPVQFHHTLHFTKKCIHGFRTDKTKIKSKWQKYFTLQFLILFMMPFCINTALRFMTLESWISSSTVSEQPSYTPLILFHSSVLSISCRSFE